MLNSGATLPAANTSGPVQLDRMLSSLDTSARANLQKLVQGFGAALNKPGADGTTGAQGLNNARSSTRPTPSRRLRSSTRRCSVANPAI